MSAAASSSSSSQAPEPKRRRKEASESVVDALNAARDPSVVHNEKETILGHAEQQSLEGLSCSDATDGEQRCYILSEFAQLGLFLPTSVKKRDSKNNLLIDWSYLKLVPPDWYSIVFPLKASPGVYRAVSDSKLSLEDYPTASRSGKDTDTAAGFTRREDLRLVLRPQALASRCARNTS